MIPDGIVVRIGDEEENLTIESVADSLWICFEGEGLVCLVGEGDPDPAAEIDVFIAALQRAKAVIAAPEAG